MCNDWMWLFNFLWNAISWWHHLAEFGCNKCMMNTFLFKSYINECWRMGGGPSIKITLWDFLVIKIKSKRYKIFYDVRLEIQGKFHVMRMTYGRWWVSAWTLLRRSCTATDDLYNTVYSPTLLRYSFNYFQQNR